MTYKKHKTIEFVLFAILVVGLLIEILFEFPLLITPITVFHIVLCIIILINAAYDGLYCTTKYEMDRFTSVQELFAAYPEARQRFQRGLFTKGRKKK